MATNQTNVHKKMDKILQKLETLEDNDKAIAKQTNYLAQLVVLARQDSVNLHLGTERRLDDMAQILLEVKKSSDETAKKVAEILGETRKH